MICGGDELSRTQRGNNNAYCQDNEISWFPWSLGAAEKDFLEFCRFLVWLRKENPVLRRRKFFQGRQIRGVGVKDIVWYTPEGKEMSDQDWDQHHVRSLGVLLTAEAIEETDEHGRPLDGDSLFLMFNAHEEPVCFVLPRVQPPQCWERVVDTADDRPRTAVPWRDPIYPLGDRSLAVLRIRRPPGENGLHSQ